MGRYANLRLYLRLSLIRVLPILAILGCAAEDTHADRVAAGSVEVRVEDQWTVGWVGDKEFFLSEVPVAGTLELTVDQWDVLYEFEQEWHYDFDSRRNSIFFWDFIPEEGSVVTVAYLPAQ